MTSPVQEQIYCSDLSLQAGEPLYATATQTQAFLLLEYAGTWGAKALEESAIPDSVKTHLVGLGKQIRGLKTLLIKTQRQQRSASGVRFFAAALSIHPPQLYSFQLAGYESLLSLDIPAILAGDATYDLNLWRAPLYLVCANGRRDLCCARHGLPVYHALAAATQSSPEPLVWQSSHVGGHRFAANLLCLPHGLMYGRVGVETALAILDADRRERIYLPNLRGRVSDPTLAQAAEFYLRQQELEDRLDAYRLVDVQEQGPGEWLVHFRLHPAGDLLSVQVSAADSDERIFESCSLDKSTSVLRYQFQPVGG